MTLGFRACTGSRIDVTFAQPKNNSRAISRASICPPFREFMCRAVCRKLVFCIEKNANKMKNEMYLYFPTTERITL